MRTITFVALQCFQCSTMQVKQQKKSSNKWTCVVCNQKQSVRKVFAQGPMARDLRLFVQSFNMSRKVADEQGSPVPEAPTLTPPLQGTDDFGRKRRSDWTEYLDLEPKEGEYKEEGDDMGPRILTELPKELFKKPKLKNYASGSNNLVNGDDGNLYKPVFSTRRASSIVKSLDKEVRKHQTSGAITTSKSSNYMTRNDRETKTSQTVMAGKASKRSSYVTREDDELKVGNTISSADKMVEYRHHDVWEILVEDHKVEDDVHPDFL